MLFIGFGVDFGIQFAVSLREQRYRLADQPLPAALVEAAHGAGEAIALAAMALGCGFLAFLPTDYRGVSELGLIAAAGMVVAVAAQPDRPAGLADVHPAAAGARSRSAMPGWPGWTASWRGTRPRRAAAALLLGLGCAALLPWLRFDTNPLNLRSPKTEAVATFRELMRSPDTTPNTIDALAADLPAAEALARRLEALPEVAGTVTLASFVPEGAGGEAGADRRTPPTCWA